MLFSLSVRHFSPPFPPQVEAMAEWHAIFDDAWLRVRELFWVRGLIDGLECAWTSRCVTTSLVPSLPYQLSRTQSINILSSLLSLSLFSLFSFLSSLFFSLLLKQPTSRGNQPSKNGKE